VKKSEKKCLPQVCTPAICLGVNTGKIEAKNTRRIGLTLPAGIAAKIEKGARKHLMTYSAYGRFLIAKGLEAEQRDKTS